VLSPDVNDRIAAAVTELRSRGGEIAERVELGREHRRSITILLAAAVGLSLFFFLVSRPTSEFSTANTSEVVEEIHGEVGRTEEVIVHVAGKVNNPGVYTLPAGSRAVDAVAAAGGALPGASVDGINLARTLVDGEQILVGSPQSSSKESALLDLNTASLADLDRLPGVGPVLAQRIIAWRSQHGRFRSVDQLREVAGVGATKFADIKPLVRV
jgi:competence protein ComEA